MNGFDGLFFVFDTETTGVDPLEARVVELGAAYFEGRKFAEARRMLVNPGVPIPEEASRVHGITDEVVRDKPSFAEVGRRFVSHLDGSAKAGSPPLLAGYNAVSYDVPVLNNELARHGVGHRIDAARVHDPIVFVRYHMRHLRKRDLGSACVELGVTLERAHSAAADAKATGEVFFRLLERGIIPDDVEAALAEQERLRLALEAEWNEFGYWLYRDRAEGFLRMGAGKHCGLPLEMIEPSYLDFILEKSEDLTEATRAAFEAHVR
ncbi:MAG: 3'-5' exonuclease [Myxococcales bacterium]|jgi:DNA polymerase-3 subunit epsilon|nr:3'-5' exonuclease [Myxococcales bacterium]